MYHFVAQTIEIKRSYHQFLHNFVIPYKICILSPIFFLQVKVYATHVKKKEWVSVKKYQILYTIIVGKVMYLYISIPKMYPYKGFQHEFKKQIL